MPLGEGGCWAKNKNAATQINKIQAYLQKYHKMSCNFP